jgi:hypothetical protein
MTIITLAAIWIGALWLYVLIMGARAAHKAGTLSLFWKLHLYPLLPIALALDVLFNLIFGLMFLEPPHELLFSSKIERHVRHSRGWRLRLAEFWMRNLNVFDKYHITRR